MAQCSLCVYWSGQTGLIGNSLMCAVNVPHINNSDHESGGYVGTAYKKHNCPDFEQKPKEKHPLLTREGMLKDALARGLITQREYGIELSYLSTRRVEQPRIINLR